MSNTVHLFVLTLLLFLFYRKRANKIILTLMSGILVWLFARSACHIGASGLIPVFGRGISLGIGIVDTIWGDDFLNE